MMSESIVVEMGGRFELDIWNVLFSSRPQKLIETGTYVGMGSTRIIASLLKRLGIHGATFLSIEVNPRLCEKARTNLEIFGLLDIVLVVNGLSVERKDLLSKEEICERFQKDRWPEGIYIDHEEEQRTDLYYEETDFSDVPDNQLLECLRAFDLRPDFVLLDSGGHVGEIEFRILMDNLKGPCTIVLDDIFHVKHWNSYHSMLKDKRFEIVALRTEKFGYCISSFHPSEGGGEG